MYDKNNPFLASIKERYSLCKDGSHKETQHIVLDLKGSDIKYEVGDCIAIFPKNDQELVENTIFVLNEKSDTLIRDKTGKEITLGDFLAFKANINEVSRKLLQEVKERQTNPIKKEKLERLFEECNKEDLKKFLAHNTLYDILSANKEVEFPVQELVLMLMPLLPRFYSIASSYHAVGEEVHLTVALLKYQANEIVRTGVCTQFLCKEAPLNQAVIPVYIQKHHGFTLPHHEAPIIMIGPGTGVAPFRAFLQERMIKNAPGKNWLFFGECHREYNFFYEDYWQELVEQDKLQLAAAFSRDQEYKVYVQHRMLEHAEELFRWIDEGAYLYVCGDAHRMAKDVEATLLQILQQEGRMTDEQAKLYLKQLRQSKRYLRDVY